MPNEKDFACGFTVEQVKGSYPEIPDDKIARFLELNDDEICEVMGEAGWRYITKNIKREEFYE